MVKGKLQTIINNSLGVAKDKFSSLIDTVSKEQKIIIEETIASLVKSVMSPNEMLTADDIESFRVIWKKNFPIQDVDRILGRLYAASNIKIEEATRVLRKLSLEQCSLVFKSLVNLAANSGKPEVAFAYLNTLAEALDLSTDEFLAQKEEAILNASKRQKLISSGRGILVALIFVAIFILTATYLRSVIFGLILAFLLLPVEKFFEKRLKKEKSFSSKIFNVIAGFGGLFKKLKSKIHKSKRQLTEAEIEKKQQLLLIHRAVSLTATCFFIFVTLIILFFTVISMGYLNNTRDRVNNYVTAKFEPKEVDKVETEVEEKNEAEVKTEVENVEVAENEEEETEEVDTLASIKEKLDALKLKFESNVIVKPILDQLSLYLNDPKSKQDLVDLAIEKTGGFLHFTTKLISSFCTLMLDLLLTIFFFLLFLNKIAEFNHNNKSNNKNYFVRTIFNGQWLPKATEENLAESERIISELVHKLKVWLRGYALLITIDFTVYSIAFYFLDVPYFLILGAVAGMGILLPFIGPIASTILTVLVTLAVGGPEVTALQIAGIIIIYLIHNGITEQFILYPMVIGESLELTTLETIIVVLLGGIFAGITGMIFALPVAAIIKYLIPQIYRIRK